jgi:hypothetical protein
MRKAWPVTHRNDRGGNKQPPTHRNDQGVKQQSLTHSSHDHRYVLLIVITIWSFPLSWLITGFATRVKRRVPNMEQELLTFPEYLSSPSVFSLVRVARSLFCVCVFCTLLFSVGYCVVCPSSIYSFWLHYLFGIFKLFFLYVFNFPLSSLRWLSGSYWRKYLCVSLKIIASYYYCSWRHINGHWFNCDLSNVKIWLKHIFYIRNV